MLVLGIESSCDETGVALVDASGAGVPRLLSHALYSQIAMHQAYGGVVPELASRDHIRRVLPLTQQVMAEAGSSLAQVDVVAYTRGPGLAGARVSHHIHLRQAATRLCHHLLRQGQYTADVVAAGQFGYHATIGLVHGDLAVQRMRQQARHADAAGIHQRHAGFITTRFDT